ncbi:hypothetical protein B0I35DRAFT_234221 [Stachybotrys elegans]|uniref:Anaphase-promoting complex subunit 4 WD40 domain-containing protein n=1 Tax=Stachybotrys elegans TaxID=80388 RepID=A0A8K0SR85_9HYPO|nr:hypothetical protein B0I35DRAFT_234221 [Stachybotrys elegans]
MEDLVVGDDTGIIYYYMVEWPSNWEVTRDTWSGSMTLVAKLSLHSQQVCGLSWSADGQFFASGGNDNLCCFYSVDEVLGERREAVYDDRLGTRPPEGHGSEPEALALGMSLSRSNRQSIARSTNPWGSGGARRRAATRSSPNGFRRLGLSSAKHRWIHGAAVKAIAFCPWRDELVATGGGSTDKCIHFFHTVSGSALATIAVSAQVTSLI